MTDVVVVAVRGGGARGPTERGWHRWWLGRDIERSGGSSSRLQLLHALLNFLQAEVVMHLLEGRKRRRVREDGAKMVKVLIQPAEDVEDEDTVGDVNTEVNEGVNEALYLEAVVVHIEVTLNKVPEGGVDVEGASLPIANEAII
jgi:hypothetical protein